MVSEQIAELSEKINSLEKLYEHINQQVLHNEMVLWTVILGVFTAIGIALYFIAKSLVQSGVEEGIKNILSDNELKLDKKNPEILGTLKFNNTENDNVNVRLVKLKDEPIVNIETDKNNAIMTINHREVLTEEFYTIRGTLVNGCFGDFKFSIIHLGESKLIELSFNDLKFGLNNKHEITMLPKGYYPNTNMRFHGVDEQNSEFIFDITTNGRVIVQNGDIRAKGVNAYVVFMVHEEK